ncbi:phage terminase, small subunit [Gottschalkia purinilytica]|uniref:Phage terminase, small subunit n=1 Tax=Gottschalkia purinilytica TaxID=1503 RepID=A0A0L0W6M1_GOTPU|nr:terminase small subunit [Gottschalkia purinilytica]KNF07158.1 phage terminase, small subunit [Gottschalkia purinilytica]
MKEIRGPDYELAEKDYMLGMKYKDIAEKYNVSINTVKSWKQRYNWNRKGVHTKSKRVHTQKEVAPKKETIEKVAEIEETELTEKQRLFCLYYVKTFNATQSAIKAGYSKDTAHVIGYENLRKPNIAKEIRRLKGTMHQDIFIDAMDILNKYIKIAFADITDYVTFGQKEVQAMGAFGPLEDKEGRPITKIINYVDLKESSELDGTVLGEVSQGKDGVKVKLLDKMKALEKLELYFDLFPDKFKRQIEEEKVKIAQEKLQLEKAKAQSSNEKENEVADMLRGLVDDFND